MCSSPLFSNRSGGYRRTALRAVVLLLLVALMLVQTKLVFGQSPIDAKALKASADALKDEQYEIANELSKSYPNEFDVLRVMGFAHSSHGNLDKMFQCWEQCRKLQPNRADIYDQLGRYSSQIEKYDDAIRYWNQALQIDAKLPGVHQQLGNAYLSLAKLNEAEVALQRAIKISPNDAQSHYLLGEVLFQQERFEEAKTSYLAAVDLRPDHSNSYYGLVKVCARLGQTEDLAKYSQRFQALEDAASKADMEYRRSFDDLQEMRKRLAVTCVDAGRVYLAHASPANAQRLWMRAAELDSMNSQCRSLLVSLLLKKKDTTNAIRYLKELTKLEPKNASNFQKLGYLQAQMRNFAGAETSFKMAIQAAPKRAIGYRDLAKFYLNTRQRASDAKRMAQRALQMEPVAESHFVLGWAQAATGNRREALRLLSQAVQLEPENATYKRLYDAVANATSKKK